ncbi:phosphatidylinositol N-acetylglucosaminyltransferase subunit Y-domain-containing protein, partial [Scenedesmus sp. NREL 46B-D3]
AYADDLSAGSQTVDHKAVLKAKLLGYSMLAMGATLVGTTLLVLVSKVLPSASYKPLLAIQQDQYYVFLAPLMIPMLLIAVTVNWFSLKLFKHNS